MWARALIKISTQFHQIVLNLQPLEIISVVFSLVVSEAK